MKLKADFKKTTSPGGGKNAMKIVTVAISVLALALTFLYLQNVDSAAKDTVEVVQLKRDLAASAVISEDDIVRYNIVRKDYDDEMTLYADAVDGKSEDYVIGKYTAYNLRRSTVLYKDQVTSKRPIRNAWLYELGEGEEVVTIPYSSAEAGGDILLPGDSVRIRVSYETEGGGAGEGENPNASYGGNGKRVRTEDLFESIVVRDMLNSSGHSVYEVYSEVMRLSADERQKVMSSKEFISNIKPKALLLSGTAEDMERYSAYKVSGSRGSLLITILSRSGDSVVGLGSLPTLETEVRSWMEGNREN